ncbi:MAG TPA: LacI family DNA-binding transcriptional regulator [Opitutaceae bacterium]|nr:LacI family DNA-binding transcriptional regulator [Opitutaceae bacterium]
MAKNKPATITDVARVANVSLGTVSRVMNNHADVNAEIRARVLDAARTLNYSRLRQRRTPAEHPNGGLAVGNIAMIFFGMEDTLAHLPVVGAAMQGIEHALAAHGRNILLANIPRGDRVPPFLAERRVDGLILKGPNQGLLPAESDSELLANIAGFPHVWLMGRLANARGDHCNFDTDAAGRLVAEHFHAKGHRRIAFLNPKPGQTQFEKLKIAFFASATRLGGEAVLLETERHDALTWPLPAMTLQENVNALVERWAKLPAKSRPTGVFVPSDRTAVQLYSALERRDVRVGRDISVISCNNEQSLLMDLNPVPTTVDVHAEFIGRRTVDQLLWRMQHPRETQSVQVLVEPTLVERDSVVAI